MCSDLRADSGDGALPGATFLVRANAGTPLIYSANLAGGGSGVAYDFFMTVEQLE